MNPEAKRFRQNQRGRMSAVIYTTTDDEREAREIAERLWYDHHRRAIVERVFLMALRRDPLTPRTTNRFAVIAEPSKPDEDDDEEES